MSDLPADSLDSLAFRELLTRIDRQREEGLKFAAEQRKLTAETEKLTAKAAKLRRERFLAPLLAAGALGGIIAGTASYLLNNLPAILRGIGG